MRRASSWTASLTAHRYPDQFEAWCQWRDAGIDLDDELSGCDAPSMNAKDIKEAEAEEAIARQSLACESAERSRRLIPSERPFAADLASTKETNS